MTSISSTKGKESHGIHTLEFEDPKRQMKYLKKVVKKQGNEIAKDIGKIEIIIQKVKEEIKKNHKSFQKINERINFLEKGIHKEKDPKFGTWTTFREDQENIPTNLADEVSKYSSTRRREYPSVDRADLLIMWNKIQKDVKKSLEDTLTAKKLNTVTARAESHPVTNREYRDDLRDSIGKYKSAYGIVTEKVSPVKRIQYNSRKTSAWRVALESETSRSGRIIDQKANFNNLKKRRYRTGNIREKQERKRKNVTNLASFSPFSTIKSRDKEIEVHQKRLKSKENLSKLDMIYHELQSMEQEWKVN